MTRKPTPEPEARFIGGGGLAILLWSASFILVAFALGVWWYALPAVPLPIYLVYLLHGLLLLVAAWRCWHRTSIRGILILSDSPNWKSYIEEHWLPRLDGKVVILNWSERSKWESSLPVRIFRRFGMAGGHLNFNPSVILLRGLRYPLVYRYFYAFRDAKHGNMTALRHLEEHMFAELDA